MKSPFFVSIFLLIAVPVPGAEPAAAPVSPATLVADIVAGHPELAWYVAELDAVRAARKFAAARPDPELSVEIGRKRSRDVSGALAGEGTTWSLSLAQTFEWPGRAALRKALANQQVELAELGLARFRRALAARAQTLAFGLSSADARAAAIREVADRFSALKEIFLAREPAGLTPQLETRIIEAAELVLQRRAVDADLALHAALVELNQLRGLPADTPLRLSRPALAFRDAPPIAELLASARERNFEFQTRRLELAQQDTSLLLARRERTPALTVRPFASRETAGDRETTVGVGLSVPLPAGPRTRGAIEVADARRRQAEAALAAAERELTRDVLTTAHAFSTRLAEIRRWPPGAANAFREAAAAADRHYRLGAVPIGTYVELQNRYLDAIEAMLDSQRAALESGLHLQHLTGLDFEPVTAEP
ncbi:MAG: TolC family protein [Verrucomicrobia bacterium]|nr:TolC family protein [Verrucomicrobiota bacterium]